MPQRGRISPQEISPLIIEMAYMARSFKQPSLHLANASITLPEPAGNQSGAAMLLEWRCVLCDDFTSPIILLLYFNRASRGLN